MTICGTGHRPNKLGGYSNDVLRKLVALADQWLAEHNPDLVISGMALGWDTALAIAALRRGIRTKGYIPFEGQESRWPVESQRRYRTILGKCVGMTIASNQGYSPAAMQRRNELMVDDSDLVLALWDGGEQGGTWNCVEYAQKKGSEVVNLWEMYHA